VPKGDHGDVKVRRLARAGTEFCGIAGRDRGHSDLVSGQIDAEQRDVRRGDRGPVLAGLQRAAGNRGDEHGCCHKGQRCQQQAYRQSPMAGRLVTRLCRGLPARAVIDLW
jgi:hypothetical protein